MGVTGLLPNLKEIQEKSSLEKYRGKTLAIDTYGWLHRGLISCAQQLCQDQPTRSYVTSIMKKVDMLRHFGVEPYFVFDGAALPTKAETANDRRAKREEARRKADELLRTGKKLAAWKEFMKAACVTSQMAKSVMVELDKHNIKYIVAPYEADPQMVYLEKIGLVNGILSEDSDLLIFGCNRLITKLKDDGTCVEVCKENFDKVKLIPYLSKYTQEQLRLVAMLSGCDYTKGIPGVGIKTAFNLVKKYNNLDKVIAALRSDGKAIPDDFQDEFNKANLAFQFQKVFNPKAQVLTTLVEYPSGFNLDFEVLESCCGKTFTNELYRQICNGNIHPNTHEVLISREQSLTSLKSNSVSYNSKKVATPIQRSQSSAPPAKQRRSVLDMMSVKVLKETMISPPRKKPNLKTGLSPTSRKIENIQDVSATPAGDTSKFFKTTSLPTPEISKPRFDSSMLSGDSDFTEEASSPIQSSKPLTTNILDELTDDDLNLSETQEDAIVDVKMENLDEDEDLDDEIEESPVKPSKLSLFRATLRDSFLFDANRAIKTPVSRANSFTKTFIQAPEELSLSDSTSESFVSIPANESISEEESQLTSNNLKLNLKFASTTCAQESVDDLSDDNSLPQINPSPIKLTQRVSIKSFAFRG